MKRFFKLFLIVVMTLVLAFSFVACNNDPPPDDDGGSGSGIETGTGTETGSGSGTGTGTGTGSGSTSGDGTGSGDSGATPAPPLNVADTWIYTGKEWRSDAHNRSYMSATVVNAIVFLPDNTGVFQSLNIVDENTPTVNFQCTFTYSTTDVGVSVSTDTNNSYFGDFYFDFLPENGLKGRRTDSTDYYIYNYFYYFERASAMEQEGYVPYVMPTQQQITKEQKEAFSGRWEATKYTENGEEKTYWRSADILKINPDGFYYNLTQSTQDADPSEATGFWTFDNTTVTLARDTATVGQSFSLENGQLVYTYTGGTGDICKVYYTKTMGYANVSQQNAHLVGKWNMTEGVLTFDAISINLVQLGMQFTCEFFDDSTATLTMTADGIVVTYDAFWTVTDSNVFVSTFISFDDDDFIFENGKLLSSESLEQDGVVFEGTITLEKQAS